MVRLVIVNPYSGTSRGVKYAKTINKVFEDLKKEYEFDDNVFIEYTEYIGHATEIVLEYGIKCTNDDIVIYVVGGDGTVSEVATAINNKKNMHMVVIPRGTGNDFARVTNSYRSIRKIIKASLQIQPEKVDSILVNRRTSANMINCGFDAAICNNMNHFRRIPFISGSLKYKLAIVYTIFSPNTYNLKIRVDNKVFKGKYTLVAIGNNKYCGGGINMLPDADISDGYLDICIIKNTTLIQKLIYLPKLTKGKHRNLNIVTMLRGKKVYIASNRKIPICIDGEVLFTKGFIAKVSEKTLSVIKTLDK